MNPITTPRRMRRVRAARALAVLPLLVALAGCGSDDGDAHTLVGYRPSGAQVVDTVGLPDATAGDAAFSFTAQPGHLLVVYFGYTSCPDVCPTTLAMLKSALKQLGDDASKVQLAMATVDPNRDSDEVLTAYVRSFVPDAHALRTDDPAQLQAAADAFGVSYSVTTDAAGKVEVSHSGAMYVVDDRGEVVLTWPFGVVADDVAGDLRIVLDEAAQRSAA